MSTKEQKTHQEFLNSLRARLNVDEATIVHLERRLTGKWISFLSKARQKLTAKSQYDPLESFEQKFLTKRLFAAQGSIFGARGGLVRACSREILSRQFLGLCRENLPLYC